MPSGQRKEVIGKAVWSEGGRDREADGTGDGHLVKNSMD